MSEFREDLVRFTYVRDEKYRPVATVAWRARKLESGSTVITLGGSFCSGHDSFIKKEGRELARTRLESDPAEVLIGGPADCKLQLAMAVRVALGILPQNDGKPPAWVGTSKRARRIFDRAFKRQLASEHK